MLSDRVAHWEWMLRKRRAQLADAIGRPFTYRHHLVGPFVYHPFDDLSRQMLLYQFEEPELRFAIRYAQRGGLILDVGANIGVFTVACARAARAKGHVIAFEPSPAAFKRLQLTCRRLGLTNVDLLPIAAAQDNGRRRFVSDGVHDLRHHLADERREAAAQSIEVDVRRLDDVCGDRRGLVTLLKIDVEGHEVEVLMGAAGILEQRRAGLIVEVYPQALTAAGASVATLRNLLSRTHECIAVVAQDGTVHDGASEFVVKPPHEMLNTLWAPRS